MLKSILTGMAIVMFFTGVCFAGPHADEARRLAEFYRELKGVKIAVDDPVQVRIQGNTIGPHPKSVEGLARRLVKTGYFSNSKVLKYQKKSGRVYSFEIQAVKFDLQDGKPNPDVYEPDLISALSTAQNFVEKRLNSPTLDFPFYPVEKQVDYLGGRKYLVSSFFDIQNQYGATVRKPYTVRVREGSDGYWYMEGMDF